MFFQEKNKQKLQKAQIEAIFEAFQQGRIQHILRLIYSTSNKWNYRFLERQTTQYTFNKPTSTNLMSLEKMDNYIEFRKTR